MEIKTLSKSLTEKLNVKNVKNQCISESGRLISDVIKICNLLDIPSYLVIMDIDSLNHDFLLSFFKKLVLVKISFIG